MQRLRRQRREYFPAPLEAFDDLDAPDTLELLGKAPDPDQARKLTRAQVSAALKRTRRRNIPDKAAAILAALRSEQLAQPTVLAAACATTARSLIAVITVLNEQVKALEAQVKECRVTSDGMEIPSKTLGLLARYETHDGIPSVWRNVKSRQELASLRFVGFAHCYVSALLQRIGPDNGKLYERRRLCPANLIDDLAGPR